MREPWRGTYTYGTSELIEYLRRLRRGERLSVSATYLLHREIYLQSQERSLIKLPEETPHCDAHLIPFETITVLDETIKLDQ